MKRFLFLLTAAALGAVLTMTSCNKDAEGPVAPTTDRLMTFTLTLSEEAGTRATFEEKVEEGVFKGLKAKWEKGDRLSVVLSGSSYDNAVTFTQTGDLSDDGKTARFSGVIPESWGDLEGERLCFIYPPFTEGDYIRDWTRQDGSLEHLPLNDNLWLYATYKEGGLSDISRSRQVYFLRLAKGLRFCDASFNGSVTFELTGSSVVSKLTKTDEYVYATHHDGIFVGPVPVSGGKLTSDVYLAFNRGALEISNMGINVTSGYGDWCKQYVLLYKIDWARGKMYSLKDVNMLTQPETIEVGQVLGGDGKYYKTNGEAVEACGSAIGVVVYLGNQQDCTRGLALAMREANYNPYSVYPLSPVSWSEAHSAISKWAENNPVEFGTWRLPSAYDWQRIFIACGSKSEYVGDLSNASGFQFNPGNFHDILKNALAREVTKEYPYWSITSYSSSYAWAYNFEYSRFDNRNQNADGHARAVFAY